MPEGLRWASGVLLLLTGSLLIAVLPHGEQLVEGDRQAFAEFMLHGGRMLPLTVGSVSAVLVYGFIRARAWSRHLALISGWAVTICSLLSWQGLTLSSVWVLLCFGCMPIWYLYFRPSVRKYFGAHQETPLT
jgi:hypothetical protein